MRLLKHLFLATLAIIASTFMAKAQFANMAPDETIKWETSTKDLGNNTFELIFTGSIIDNWHTYALGDSSPYTSFNISLDNSLEKIGDAYTLTDPIEEDEMQVFYNKIIIGQKVKLKSDYAQANASIVWVSCSGGTCASPEEFEASILINPKGLAINNTDNKNVSSDNTFIPDPDNQTIEQGNTNSSADSSSLWSLIIEAILWGFAMILTPCVFPMIPMTISFFMKGSSSASAGRFKAFMYGLFIVLLYTLPICIIIGLTLLLGGDSITADIFNWLATHWIPNLIFFIVFIIFAASFFGAFEITLPSSIVNKSDKNADKKGLAGIFFMALTLVLVSFSCTGPIVGTVLIKSTQGEFWAPMVTMLAFSLAFALPFTIFALFPSLLTKLKSGSWLNSVKVVLGFIEVALAFKFLSIPDQTYHWGLLDREVYLAIWIVVFGLLGLYLLGKIRFAHDDKLEKIGVFRLSLVILVFSFVVYMIPGMFGAPLKALSGYLPPLESQDFITYNTKANMSLSINTEAKPKQKYDLSLPLNLSGYFTLEEGLEAAKKAGKPVFVDITGHGCTNCREMEAKVWSDPKVYQMLQNDFIIVALYTDDKTTLEKEDWITTDKGKILKDMGRKNAYIARKRFGVNAQPNYAILSADGDSLVPVRGYNLDVNEYVKFLQAGIDANNKKK